MKSTTISKVAAARYARATLQLAAERKATPEVIAHAAALHEAVMEKGLAENLANPRLAKAQRVTLVAGIAKSCKLNPVLANLLHLLAQNSRLGLLSTVLHEIQTLADTASGTARVQVQAANPLSEAQQTSLKATIKAELRAKDVILETTANPALLGGFMAFFGGKVWDASLAGQFRRLKDSLVQTTQNYHQNH